MIRFASPRDATRIAEIQVSSWRVAYQSILEDEYLSKLSTEKRAEKWLQIINTNPLDLLVFEIDAQVTGWINFGACRDDDSPKNGEVYAIYIHPDHCGKGTGSLLMASAERELLNRGHFQISLWLLEQNHSAQSFYESLRYEKDGTRKLITLGNREVCEMRMTRELTQVF